VEAEPPNDHALVVARDAERVVLAQAIDDSRGIGAIADEVPRDGEASAAAPLDVREDGVERLEVRMDVSQQRPAHIRPPAARSGSEVRPLRRDETQATAGAWLPRRPTPRARGHAGSGLHRRRRTT